MNKDLKTCPFCGGNAKLKYYSPDRSSIVECESCGGQTCKFFVSNEYSSDEEAIKYWNARVEEVTS